MTARLAREDINNRLDELDGWDLTEDDLGIVKHLVFGDFNEAWGFMFRVALLSEQEQHHPRLLNDYNRIEIILSTHEDGGVTELDLEMAAKIDRLIWNSDPEVFRESA